MLAELETCETLAKNFTSDFGECFKSNKPIEDSCLCTEAISESEVELLKACDVNKEFNAAKDAKGECFTAFSKCKKAEDAAVEGIDTCKDCGKESSLEEELFLNMHIYIPRCVYLEHSVRSKNGLILPKGQWYAPSAVINDAWYCMVLHSIALYCIVLHGIAWYCMVLHGIAWYCMVLHGITWYCIVLHGIAWYCMIWHGFAWYCMVWHGFAWYCMVLHGIALSCTTLHHLAPEYVRVC